VVRNKKEIIKYFVEHFSEEVWERPTLGGINFPSLSVEEVMQLERPYKEVEIKDIIDSLKKQ
jgi:hypothetical protein